VSYTRHVCQGGHRYADLCPLLRLLRVRPLHLFSGPCSGHAHDYPRVQLPAIHAQGRVLFDTGVHRQAITDPIGRLGERRATRLTVRSQVGDDVVSQLARLGMRPEDITHVINSHVHVDHCGGNEFFPRATFIVQSREMARARGPDNPYKSRDFDHPLTYQLIDGDYDIFGDGQLVLIPTYGHTPGWYIHESTPRIWTFYGFCPLLILMAKSEIRTMCLRHRPEKQVSQHSSSYKTDFAISITFGDSGELKQNCP
jgi:hypothetical protein